jgi:hypothetical protein
MNAMTPDFYGPIHKAIRLAMCDFLVLAGSTDGADRAAWERIEASWRRIEELLHAHSHYEDTHIHPMIRIAAPQIAASLDAEHETLDRGLREIATAFAVMAPLDEAAARRSAARDVYLTFAAFLPDYFRHLIAEETRAMPALVDHFPPAALFATHRALLGSIPPDKKLADLPLIARSLAPQERIGLMVGALESAPCAFFADACRIMEEAIGPEAYAPVAEALSLKAA